MGSLRKSKSFSLLGKNSICWRSQVYEYQGSLWLATITETPCMIKACRNSQRRDNANSTGERKRKTSVWPFYPNKRSSGPLLSVRLLECNTQLLNHDLGLKYPEYIHKRVSKMACVCTSRPGEAKISGSLGFTGQSA